MPDVMVFKNDARVLPLPTTRKELTCNGVSELRKLCNQRSQPPKWNGRRIEQQKKNADAKVSLQYFESCCLDRLLTCLVKYKLDNKIDRVVLKNKKSRR
jgi:hypothetical protein